MSVGGQSNAPQTPFSPNYRERRSVQPRGPGNAYTQRPGQQPNPQQPAQLRPAPQPNQPNQPPPAGEPTASTMALVPATKDGVSGYYTDGSMRNFVPDTPFGGGFGGGYSSPFGGGFGGGYSTPFSDYGGGFGGGFGQPSQYGGGYGGGYSSPYMSPSMMGGLASLFGGMQGGGFQGMFNSPSQAQRYDPYSFNPQADAQRQQQQMFMDREANTTDYQRLMQRKNQAANAPPASSSPSMGFGLGLGGMPVRAPSDYEIAQSLGYGDSGIRDMRVRTPEESEQEDKTRQARAKSYLDSIGYGTEGFDSSKYEVRRQPRSPSPGLSGLFSGLA